MIIDSCFTYRIILRLRFIDGVIRTTSSALHLQYHYHTASILIQINARFEFNRTDTVRLLTVLHTLSIQGEENEKLFRTFVTIIRIYITPSAQQYKLERY